MRKLTIGVVIGSLRRDSFSRKIANLLIGMMPERLDMKILDISALSFYNQDIETDGTTPQAWEDFRAQVRSCDGFLFVTPEYNRSYPAVLKNAIDIGSRPYGKNSWGGKPAAVISATPGNLGGAGANFHLRQVLACLSVPVMPNEVYLSQVTDFLGKDGSLTNEGTGKFLQSVANDFAAWVDKFTS